MTLLEEFPAKIAQRFSAGFRRQTTNQVPSGTEDPRLPYQIFFRPCRDLRVIEYRLTPSHKWLGYFRARDYLGTTMHSFNSCLMHCVFSTKERRSFLTANIRDRLWPYLGGIARENDMKALSIGGVADHVHLLLSLPTTLSVSKAMQLLKGNSSKWLRETFPELRAQGFTWQDGFGSFSIGVSGVEDTIHYIQTQEEHHRQRSFREELEIFLKKHGCAYEATMLD